MLTPEVTATLNAEVTTSFQTLAALFAGKRAGRYSNYANANLLNRGDTTVRYSIVEPGIAASTGNSCTLLPGEQVDISKMNSELVYLLGEGSSTDTVEFRGRIL